MTTEPEPELQSRFRPVGSQWAVAGFVIVMAAFSMLLHEVYARGVEQSSLLFVGLPTFLGVALALTPRATTAIGMALRGVTLALLISAMFFHEGFICILMAAPLFYGFAVIAALLVDAIRASRKGPRSFAVGALSLLLLASGEGAIPGLAFDRAETVTVTRQVAASPEALAAALAGPLPVDAPLPTFLRLGFPRPVAADGEGLAVGDRRRIHFAGGEGHPGDMVFEVGARTERSVRFDLVDDASHIAHWLDWDVSEVTWEPVDGGTRVTWTVHFTRRLDPAWYFAPAERYAISLAAAHLVDTFGAVASTP